MVEPLGESCNKRDENKCKIVNNFGSYNGISITVFFGERKPLHIYQLLFIGLVNLFLNMPGHTGN